ncbi:SMI1/KNR4 family protein [Streptomyces sp. NPDC006984]|uniref:SMI1/KNR4 family protein n=1 Tax=Streptomyces sp. NPDC006984 TaxID=3155463 RepID=UPI0033E40692
MLTVARLEEVVSGLRAHRPEQPRGIDFALVTQLLGTGLPSDFQELSRAYPTLEFDGFLRVPTPRPGGEEKYVDGLRYELEVLQDLVDEDMAEGYVGYPEPGGLLPWSESLSGDVFYWRTVGDDPDGWPVVVNSRNDEWWEFEGGALAFLVGLVDGTVERRGLPADVPGRDPQVRVYGP